MAIELLCRQLGMTRVYEADGTSVPVTVPEASSNTVVQKKTAETDGYAAPQLGAFDRRPKTLPAPLVGHYAKAGAAPKRRLAESRLPAEEMECKLLYLRGSVPGHHDALVRVLAAVGTGA